MPAGLLLVGLLVCLSGCAPAPTLPPGVTVRIFQNRFDYADRVLEVSVTNAGTVPFTSGAPGSTPLASRPPPPGPPAFGSNRE